MRSLVFIFILLFAKTSFAFIGGNRRMSIVELEEARRIAMTTAVKANYFTLIEDRSVLNQLFNKLKTVRLNVPDMGYDFTTCQPNTLAYVEMYIDNNTINLCYLSLIGTTEKLAQTLIHESAHLIGHEDECDASRIELLVFRLANKPLVYRNNYLESCGLK